MTRIYLGGWKEDTGTVSGLVGFGKALSFEDGQVEQIILGFVAFFVVL